jgi:hypothetical protein
MAVLLGLLVLIPTDCEKEAREQQSKAWSKKYFLFINHVLIGNDKGRMPPG